MLAAASGDYTVTQETLGTFYGHETGNRATGEYSKSENATEDYTVIQNGSGDANYDLTMTGTNTYTDEEDGNTVTGIYARTKNGTDNYSITITGTKTGGTYEQNVSGQETYTLVDNGNLATESFIRTIDIDQSEYERTSTGDGVEMPTDSGETDYHWEQNGNTPTGTFDLTKTGTSRYDLLEDFFDISNTGNGQTPGHMNVYPFAQTFVDGPPNGFENPWSPAMERLPPPTPRELPPLQLAPPLMHAPDFRSGEIMEAGIGWGNLFRGVMRLFQRGGGRSASLTPSAWIAGQRAAGWSNNTMLQHARTMCEGHRRLGLPTRFWTDVMHLLGH